MNALTQMFVNEGYASSVLADEPIKQFSAEQFEDCAAASADRVAKTNAGAIGTIGDRDDWYFEGIELLDGIAARRINRDADQSCFGTFYWMDGGFH